MDRENLELLYGYDRVMPELARQVERWSTASSPWHAAGHRGHLADPVYPDPAMTTPIQPIPVPTPPAKMPVQVTMLPAESIYKTDPAKMHVLAGVYVKFNAFFMGLPTDGGIAMPPMNIYLRIQAHDVAPVRLDVCARVLTLNGIEHGYGTMVLGMGGPPVVQDAFAMEAFGVIPEWVVPAKDGVPIYGDKANSALVRLEAWVDGKIAGSTLVAYSLAPAPKVSA